MNYVSPLTHNMNVTIDCIHHAHTHIRSCLYISTSKPRGSIVMRGQKLCRNCGTPTGPRTRVCKHCDTTFEFTTASTKRISKTKRTVTCDDWKQLQKGDKIRVLKGSGPYFLSNEHERIAIGCKGVYTVRSLDNTGIRAHGTYGCEYVWMGPPTFSEQSRIMREPHHIQRIVSTR